MFQYKLRIVIIAVLSASGSIFCMINEHWGLGIYLLSFLLIAVYHEVRIILVNDIRYINYRIGE